MSTSLKQLSTSHFMRYFTFALPDINGKLQEHFGYGQRWLSERHNWDGASLRGGRRPSYCIESAITTFTHLLYGH
jgi:hypothetical protein